jgi:arsenite transporter
MSKTTTDDAAVLARLSTLDRFLPVWILIAMAAGLLLGRFVPSVQSALDAVQIDGTSLPIALGLLLMMYPVLARVRYEDMSRVTGDRRLLWLSLVLNWLIGPLLMFSLAWLFLAEYPALRTGLIVIGLARCIAMVLIWNDLACGDREAGALLVAINSVFQIIAYALLGTFYLTILPGWLGLDTQDVQFSTWDITKAVLIFLGIPLVAGYFRASSGTTTSSPHESHRLPCMGCSSRSWSCLRCRVKPSPAIQHRLSASRFHSLCISQSCGVSLSPQAQQQAWGIRRPPRSLSPLPGTILSSRSL